MVQNNKNPKETTLLEDFGKFKPVHNVVRRGELCPVCGIGILEYNGLLDLECPECGFCEGPGGGCT